MLILLGQVQTGAHNIITEAGLDVVLDDDILRSDSTTGRSGFPVRIVVSNTSNMYGDIKLDKSAAANCVSTNPLPIPSISS
jgi:hypothetical protein